MKTEIKLARILDKTLALARIADDKAYKDLMFLKNKSFYQITMSKIMKHYRLFKAMDNSCTRYKLREDYYILEALNSRKHKPYDPEKQVPHAIYYTTNKEIKKLADIKGRLFPLTSFSYWKI